MKNNLLRNLLIAGFLATTTLTMTESAFASTSTSTSTSAFSATGNVDEDVTTADAEGNIQGLQNLKYHELTPELQAAARNAMQSMGLTEYQLQNEALFSFTRNGKSHKLNIKHKNIKSANNVFALSVKNASAIAQLKYAPKPFSSLTPNQQTKVQDSLLGYGYTPGSYTQGQLDSGNAVFRIRTENDGEKIDVFWKGKLDITVDVPNIPVATPSSFHVPDLANKDNPANRVNFDKLSGANQKIVEATLLGTGINDYSEAQLKSDYSSFFVQRNADGSETIYPYWQDSPRESIEVAAETPTTRFSATSLKFGTARGASAANAFEKRLTPVAAGATGSNVGAARSAEASMIGRVIGSANTLLAQ